MGQTASRRVARAFPDREVPLDSACILVADDGPAFGLERAVIASVSGYGGEEYRRLSEEAGFDRHLVKPIGRPALEELVNNAASKQ
jgi:CheY-like chemotaxis protein